MTTTLTMADLDRLAVRAGLLDREFRFRAIDAGNSYATKSLLSGLSSRQGPLPPDMIRNAAGRAKAYLTPAEVAEWLAAVHAINRVLPDRSLGLSYDVAATF